MSSLFRGVDVKRSVAQEEGWRLGKWVGMGEAGEGERERRVEMETLMYQGIYLRAGRRDCSGRVSLVELGSRCLTTPTTSSGEVKCLFMYRLRHLYKVVTRFYITPLVLKQTRIYITFMV